MAVEPLAAHSGVQAKTEFLDHAEAALPPLALGVALLPARSRPTRLSRAAQRQAVACGEASARAGRSESLGLTPSRPPP